MSKSMLDGMNSLSYLELSLCESGILTGAGAGAPEIDGNLYCCSSNIVGGVGFIDIAGEVDDLGLAGYAHSLPGEKCRLPGEKGRLPESP
jgi:hypothetical protein